MSSRTPHHCLDLDVHRISHKRSFSPPPATESPVIKYVKKGSEFIVAFSTSVACFYYLLTKVTDNNLNQLTFFTYVITMLNALLSVPLFSHESFCDLKILVDYAQEVLPLPFLASDYWIREELAPNYISYLYAAFGIGALVYLVIFEYKRPDLTDLAMLVSFCSLSLAGYYNQRPYPVLAAMEAGVYYVKFKRHEQYVEPNKFKFILSCATFNVLALTVFDPEYFTPLFLKPSGDQDADG